jgi:hypothetical protein
MLRLRETSNDLLHAAECWGIPGHYMNNFFSLIVKIRIHDILYL